MSELAQKLVCRSVHGFSLYAVWSNATPPHIDKYELALPSGGILPFKPNALRAALTTFHAATSAWFWFAPPYRLYPVFEAEDSDKVNHYVISNETGPIFVSTELPNGVAEAIVKFQQLTGVCVTAYDVLPEAAVLVSS